MKLSISSINLRTIQILKKSIFNNKRVLWIVFIILIFFSASGSTFPNKSFIKAGQSSGKSFDSLANLEPIPSSYLELGYGLSRSSFRDFATSPLYYSGFTNNVSLAFLKHGSKFNSYLSLSYDFGNYYAIFNSTEAMSLVRRGEFAYSHIYRLSGISGDALKYDGGITINSTGNLRRNESLGNNGIGIDIFGNVLATLRLTRSFNRGLLFKSNRRDSKHISSRYRNKVFGSIDVGFINSSYRNGFIYTNQTPIQNDIRLFDNYVFSIFSGKRYRGSFGFMHYLNSGNAVSLAYQWDAFSSGGDLDIFQMAQHQLNLIYFLNTK